MNKFSVFIVRQALQSCLLKNNQLSSFNRLAYYSSSVPVKPAKGRKQLTSPLVTLISAENENKIEVMSLDQAKKLADRRQLKLVSIHDIDAQTKRPVYKLMTGSEYFAEEMKKREEKKVARKEQHLKPEKLLTIANKISEHDLRSKLAKCVKWIEKLHEIRVVISGSDESDKKKTEDIIEMIEKEMVPIGGRILQKRMSEGVARFSIMPTIKKTPKPVEADAKEPEANPEKAEVDLKKIKVDKKSLIVDKKLLENEKPPVIVQQVRSHHTMAF